MRRLLLGAVSGVVGLLFVTQVQAQPIIATFTGVIADTADPFTATFYYDTKDLTVSAGNTDYLEAVSGSTQRATYVDPTHDLTFSSIGQFSKGEYTSVVTNDDGSTDANTVHEYTIGSPSSGLDLTFGGADDFGIVTFGEDGLDYANLTPEVFSVTKDAALVTSTVPLPPAVLLLGGGLVILSLVGRGRRPQTPAT